MAYLRRSVLFIALALSACDGRNKQPTSTPPIDPGWHYSWNGGVPNIGYGFANTTGGFFGHCDANPIFALLGVAHVENAKTFTVLVDGHKRQFDVDSGYGMALPLFPNSEVRHSGTSKQLTADEDFAWIIADARHRLIVSTDSGMRWDIPPSDLIARFVGDCIAFRRAETLADVKMHRK